MAVQQSPEAQSMPEMTSGFWFIEGITPTLNIQFQLKSITFDSQSEFQRVQVVETADFGKTLVLDGKTQSAKNDEACYHESLVHPSMLLHPNPRHVYIGGGGEFATAREVLRHKSVEKCVMVDIDKVVCDICREQLPEWNDGAFEDPRMETHYEDAHAFLKTYDGKFDVIIMDIADPIEAGPGYVLYTEEFYKFAVTKLNPGGMLVTQSGPGAMYNWGECFSTIHRTLRSAFDVVVPYAADVPSFGSNWAFNVAFNLPAVDDGAEPPTEQGCDRAGAAGERGVNARNAVVGKSISEVDAMIETRLKGGADSLRFLDGTTWGGIFGLPKQVRKGLAEEKRIMTVDNPVFMY